MARRDLTLGDSFHRSKRTLLLFCSAVLVTRIPGIDITGHAGLLGVSLENVNVDLVRWLFWGAAAYYLIGFVLEAITERQSNAGSLRLGGINGLSDDMAELSTTLKHHLQMLHDHLTEPTSVANQINVLAKRTYEHLEETAKTFPKETSNTHVSPSLVEQYLKKVESVPAEVESLRSNLNQYAHMITGRLGELEDLMRDTRSDLHRLAKDVIGTRRWLFYGWEIGGGTTMFLAATVALPWSFWA